MHSWFSTRRPAHSASGRCPTECGCTFGETEFQTEFSLALAQIDWRRKARIWPTELQQGFAVKSCRALGPATLAPNWSCERPFIGWGSDTGQTIERYREAPTSYFQDSEKRFLCMDASGMAMPVVGDGCQRVVRNTGRPKSRLISAATPGQSGPSDAWDGQRSSFGNARSATSSGFYLASFASSPNRNAATRLSVVLRHPPPQSFQRCRVQ